LICFYFTIENEPCLESGYIVYVRIFLPITNIFFRPLCLYNLGIDGLKKAVT